MGKNFGTDLKLYVALPLKLITLLKLNLDLKNRDLTYNRKSLKSKFNKLNIKDKTP